MAGNEGSDGPRDNVRTLLLQGRLDEMGFAQAAEGLRLIRAFEKITNENDRRLITELAERLSR